MSHPTHSWADCWNELHQLRRDMHRLFERMRAISPGNTACSANVSQVSWLAIQFAAEEIGVTTKEILGHRRPAKVAWARHIAIYATRMISGGTLSDIQRAFGLLDHGTIKYAIRRVRQTPEKKYNRQVDQVVANLCSALNIRVNHVT